MTLACVQPGLVSLLVVLLCLQVHYGAGLLYDSIKLWALGVKNSLGKDNSFQNGEYITNATMNINFEGETITELITELLWMFDSQKANV